MKLNEREKQAIINSLKESYKNNTEMLNNGTFDEGNYVQYRQSVIDYNKQIEEYLEKVETIEGDLEIDTTKFDFSDKWSWIIIMLILAFGGGFGGNNSSE